MSVDRLEDAIDRAVREMLDVEPPADLRARVMERLPAPGSQRPASGFRLTAPGFRLLAAAAAIVLLTMVVAHRSEPVPQAPVVARSADRYLAPEPTRAVADVPLVRTPSGLPVTRRAPREEHTRIVAAAAFTADEAGAMQIAPLNTIAPISIERVAQDAIAPAGLAVRPLNTIADIQIAPLTPPPDRR